MTGQGLAVFTSIRRKVITVIGVNRWGELVPLTLPSRPKAVPTTRSAFVAFDSTHSAGHASRFDCAAGMKIAYLAHVISCYFARVLLGVLFIVDDGFGCRYMIILSPGTSLITYLIGVFKTLQVVLYSIAARVVLAP